jgi:signal transduction histidine kinase
MKMLKKAWLGLALLLPLPLLRGQPAHYRAELIGPEQGLPSLGVRALLQDREGFLWIGTENGLCRYDGRIFHCYHASEGPDRLSGNVITALAQDSAGILWAGTLDGGLCRIDPSQPPGAQVRNFYQQSGDPASLPSNRVQAVAVFDEHHLILSAESAPVVFLDTRSLRFSVWQGEGPVHPSNVCEGPPMQTGWLHRIEPTGPRQLMLSFLIGHQVWAIDTRSGLRLPSFPPPPIFAGHHTYTQCLYDSAWQYACGWLNGIARWSRRGDAQQALIPLPDEVTAMAWLEPGHLLAGTRSSGLFVVETGSLRTRPWALRLASGFDLPQQRVNTFLRDRSGQLWVGSSIGLIKLSPERKALASGPLPPYAREARIGALQALPGGQVYASTSKDLYCKAPGADSFAALSLRYKGEPLAVNEIHALPDGRLLLASENGPWIYQPATGALEAFPTIYQRDFATQWGTPNLLDYLQVQSLFEDSLQGSPLQVAGVLGYGLCLIYAREGYYQLLIETPGCDSCIQNNLVRTLARGQGGYWIATARGLYFWPFDGRQISRRMRAWFHQPGDSSSLPSDDVRCLHAEAGGGLWAGCSRGLIHLAGGKSRRVALPPGPSPLVRQILPTERGLLILRAGDWLLLDPATLRSRRLPLPSLPVQHMLAASLSEGRLMLATANEWLILPLDSLSELPATPRPYLAGLKVGETSQAVQPRLRLSYRDVFSVQISALSLDGQQPFALEYQWEGPEEHWMPFPADGWLRVAVPRPGRQRLRVRVLDPEEQLRASALLLEVEVIPPFWQTLWFFLLALASVGGLSFLAFRYQMAQLQKRQALRLRIAGDLHDEIGSALSSIALGSELAEKFLDEQPAQSRRVMSHVRRTAAQTLEDMRDIIWAIHPRQDSGEQLLARMRSVLRELLENKGIHVSFSADPSVEALTLPMEVRKNFFLIFKEAVHNISKHAEARAVEVELSQKGRQLRLDIRDDGRGFVPGERPGFGLENMQRRAEEMGGRFLLESAPGKGTRISIETP